MPTKTFRRKCYEALEPTAYPHKGLSPVNAFMAGVIILSAISAVLESEPTLRNPAKFWFFLAELLFTSIFLVEYIVRLWAEGEDPRYKGFKGRLRYATTVSALIDLCALMPLFFWYMGSEAFLLRLVRLMRIFRLARLGQFSTAWSEISEAVVARRYELLMSLVIAGGMLIWSSIMLYLVEGGMQPEAFGSIPRAMWWSVATLTTVGYGDVFPVTPIGRILAGTTALIGVGIIAMPTGILAAAFSEAVQKRRDTMHARQKKRP